MQGTISRAIRPVTDEHRKAMAFAICQIEEARFLGRYNYTSDPEGNGDPSQFHFVFDEQTIVGSVNLTMAMIDAERRIEQWERPRGEDRL